MDSKSGELAKRFSRSQHQNSLEPIPEEAKSNLSLKKQLSKSSKGNVRSLNASQKSLPSNDQSLKKLSSKQVVKRTSTLGSESKSLSKQQTSGLYKSLKPNSRTQSKKLINQISKNSLLYKNFAFRNVESLEKALVEEEGKFLQEFLEKNAQRDEYCSQEDESVKSEQSYVTSISLTETKTSDTKSQTETVSSPVSMETNRLKYLMGLTFGDEEEDEETRSLHFDVEKIFNEVEGDSGTEEVGMSEEMKQARRYLRAHKIFEFFQFIIAHLLSAVPDKPISFIVGLLDSCIIYRAGMGNAPVLYEKKHIEALFNLMDRMRTGFIEKEQYYTGMKTLGICSYEINPPTNCDGMVSQTFFVTEAYENLLGLLNELLKRKTFVANLPPPQAMRTPPPTPQMSVCSGAALKKH